MFQSLNVKQEVAKGSSSSSSSGGGGTTTTTTINVDKGGVRLYPTYTSTTISTSTSTSTSTYTPTLPPPSIGTVLALAPALVSPPKLLPPPAHHHHHLLFRLLFPLTPPGAVPCAGHMYKHKLGTTRCPEARFLQKADCDYSFPASLFLFPAHTVSPLLSSHGFIRIAVGMFLLIATRRMVVDNNGSEWKQYS
ncbi:hypothetical protein M0802_014902 [Mischocyttarus mexicanus]|nr:hypothetical protein M0802_014902 [Mischocyttarus mexicanus]